MRNSIETSGVKPGLRLWLSFIVFGLAGQVAWMVENMYFNVFLYNTVSTDARLIALMVALSAIVATLTTLVMGALSDRLGRRRVFLVLGYLLWGLATLSFAGVSVEQVGATFPNVSNVIGLTAGIVILLDCVMTFFGSTANDAAFNAYVTDVTVPATRGRVEAVLATFPLLAMLLIFGLLDPLTQAGRWSSFFIIIGVATSVVGLAGLVLLPAERAKPSTESWAKNLLYGFREETIGLNRPLYMAMILLALIACSVQIYMPYLIIYVQNYLGFSDYALLLGIVLLGASVLSVLSGRVLDRFGKLRSYPYALLAGAAGLVLMFRARSAGEVAVAGVIFLGANLILTAIAQALIKNHIPEGMAGRFQGIRMIFAVLLPMLIGPFIGAFLIRSSGEQYVEFGVAKQVPTPAIFIGSAVVLLLSLLPWLWLRQRERRHP